MYSCLAGFVEPGESDRGRGAARDAGGSRHPAAARVYYFALQPWPFPIVADDRLPRARRSRREITIDRDELEDAAGSARDEVAPMLIAASIREGSDQPPPIAIAHHIIRAWVEIATMSSPERTSTRLCAGIAVLDMVFRVAAAFRGRT